MLMPPLNARQQRFVAEYLIDLNATQAAIRAGYSPHTAFVQGSRLLSYASVRAAVEAGRQRLTESAGITAAQVLDRIWGMAEDAETPPPVRMKGYELAGKHLGMFVDRLSHEGTVGVVVERRTPALDEEE